MGSHSFEDTYYGDLSAGDAYRHLVEDALYESGRDPYNGTISTTSGVAVVPTVPLTVEAASALAETRIDKLSKWENCEAIPLVAETPPEYGPAVTKEVTITVSGTVFNDRTLLHAEVARALKVKPADITDGFYILEYSAEKKVDAVAPKEKTVTKYFVLTAGEDKLPAWDKGFATQAEARAAVGSVLRYNSYRGLQATDAEVIGITRRESGAGLVTATVSAKKVTATVKATVRPVTKKATAGTVRAGWYFYGWAAS